MTLMIVEKVTYEINWAKFKVGSSFFIPCLNPRKSRKDIVNVTKRLAYKTATKVVIEDGVRGIRIWRIA
jgi:hypothetical protein